MTQAPDFDLCIIGGGINGVGIARDAAGRGLKVLLLEQGDLAQGTSSASTKLIHGGLRYLEFYEFSLVRESLKERERLLKIAPHIIWPMSFVLPHHAAVRPLWMIRLGLFLYDRLGGKKTLQSSRLLDLAHHAYGKPLREGFSKGFSYADCWVQDARLVVLNAMDARDKGASIITHTRCIGLKCKAGKWFVEFEDIHAEKRGIVSAHMIVNAAGPWAESLLQDAGFYAEKPDIPHIKLVKGSHIVVPKQYDGDQCYMLQQKDGRIVFAIPYEHDFTLIGTTDTPFADDPAGVRIDDVETGYLCDAFNSFFRNSIAPSDVVWTYSGVRALYDDGVQEARKVTRDYTLYHHHNYEAPMISVFGGKITTYRELSERAVNMLMELSGGSAGAWTADAPLPGGDIPDGDMQRFSADLFARYPWLPDRLLRRYILHYGSEIHALLKGGGKIADLGEHYGDDVYEAEIDYLMQAEFAKEPDDILWRRTKLGLHIGQSTKDEIAAAMRIKSGKSRECRA